MTLEELKKVRAGRLRVKHYQARISALKEQQLRLTQRMTGLIAGKNRNDQMAEYVSKLDALEHNLMVATIEMEERMQRLDEEVSALPEHYEKVIRLRYFDGLKWSEVAKKAGYTERYCRKIPTCIIENLDFKNRGC